MTTKDRTPLFLKLAGCDGRQIHTTNHEVARPEYLKQNSSILRSAITGRFTATQQPSFPSNMFSNAKTSHDIYYELHGADNAENKTKILLLMGLASTSAHFQPQFHHFLFSEENQGKWKTTDFAHDVAQLLDYLGQSYPSWQDNIHVVGFSMGGMIAQELVLHNPRKFASLSLISSHSGGILGTFPPPIGLQPMLQTFSSFSKTLTKLTNGQISTPRASRFNEESLKIGKPVIFGVRMLFPEEYLNRKFDVVKRANLLREIELDSKFWSDIETNEDVISCNLIQRARKYLESKEYKKKDAKMDVRLKALFLQITGVVSHYVSWNRLKALKQMEIPVLVLYGSKDNIVNEMNSSVILKQFFKVHGYSDAGHGVNEQYREEVNEHLRKHFEHGERTFGLSSFGRKPVEPEIHPWRFIFLFLVVENALRRRIRFRRYFSKLLLGFLLIYRYGWFTKSV
eukprot:snap_masked-scaffold_19-processed-gene-4.29-mRNA-1 protein AED:1.00 eAED:1.00 QI:0/0/0/0/1/1/2/0/454